MSFKNVVQGFLKGVSGRGWFCAQQGTEAPRPKPEDLPTGLRISGLEENVDLVEFEPVSGVVTRELRPSAGSMFTCHTFSSDGAVLVTGESNGTLRLWNTFDYRCRACWPQMFKHPISAVSFFKGNSGHLVAVDKKGNLSDFAVAADIESGAEGRYKIEPLNFQHAIGRDDNLGNHPEALMHQFSSDGSVAVTVRHGAVEESASPYTAVDIIQFDGRRHDQTTITMEGAPICVPILSQNGKSLLLLCPPNSRSGDLNGSREDRPGTGIWVVPKLSFQSPAQQTCPVAGDCAFWGKGGKYLLVRNMDGAVPKLSVYKTKNLRPNQSRNPAAECEMTLRQGLSSWNARMLDNHDADSGTEVLICEADEEWRIFSVWDIKKKTKTKEVKMVLSPGNSVASSKAPSATRSILRRRSRHPPTPENHFISMILSNTFPEFCGSNDTLWFSAVSWNCQTIGISSTRMGVTAWISVFADELLKRPSVMPDQIRFDPPGHHLLMFGEDVIQAFAPPFLDEHFKTGRQIEEIDQRVTSLDEPDRMKRVVEAYQHLPNKALARAWEIGASVERRRLSWFRSRRESLRGERVVDAVLSPDNQLLALILRDFRGSLWASVRTAGPSVLDDRTYCEELPFPMNIEEGVHEFNPQRVFLTKDSHDEDSMVFLSTGDNPAAVFVGIDGQLQTTVPLGMTSCHMICRSPDADTVLLLDNDGVCILNLCERKIIDRQPYRTKVHRLAGEVHASLKWRCNGTDCLKDSHSDGRISSNGAAVLLAWDTKNSRSITITPTMKQEEYRRIILAADGCLSEFCSLSASGEQTAFLDVEDLSRGRVTIGIFSETEQKVTFRVEVDRDVQTDIAPHDLQKLLTNTFYGISEDENTLVVNTIGVSSSSSKPQRLLNNASEAESSAGNCLESELLHREEFSESKPLLKDRLNKFLIHEDIRCIPNRDLFSLVKGVTDEACIERLRMLHGLSLFNLPLATKLSIFQDAFLQKREPMKKRIKELAKKQGVKLALEWDVSREQKVSEGAPSRRGSTLSSSLSRRVTSSSMTAVPRRSAASESSNILKRALGTNRTNDIKEALHLVCSDVAPFASTARILRLSFPDLLLKESHILEEMFSRNCLLHKACELDVHVDFMDSALRWDKAVHISTSDSYLDWSEPTTQETLNEMWRDKNADEIKRMETEGNTSTRKAWLMFVRIEDAAKAGMRGIIRPLLFQHVPLRFFEFKVVRWTVMYKWLKIWRERFLYQGLEYICFLMVFSCYACLLASTATLSVSRTEVQISATCFLGMASAFGLKMAIEEFRQMLTYQIDGKECPKRNWMGLPYFFTFKWNWVDMFSCMMLVILIPLLHCLALCSSDFDEVLSILVALEAITAFVKIWYYAQPFRMFGSLVQMVGDVIRDCFAFLFLGFSVQAGFAIAFHVLFRHTAEGRGGTPESKLDIDHHNTTTMADNAEVEDVEEADKAFGNFHKSLLTLFCALLGEFDMDVYLSVRGSLSWLTVSIFVVYMLTQTIILLNFLIAVMGDTFDRVKEEEEAELLSGCAEFIDACEASLGTAQCDKINESIGKYLIVVVDPAKYASSVAVSSRPWMGKLKKIETFCINAVERGVGKMKNWMKSLEQQIKEQGNNIKTLVEEKLGASVEGDTNSAMEARIASLVEERVNSVLEQRIAPLERKLEAEKQLLENRLERLEATAEQKFNAVTEKLDMLLSLHRSGQE